MKQTPDEIKLIANMQPGALCKNGFMGSDSRSLPEILEADNAEVQAMGLTHEQLAGALEEAMNAAMRACGAPVSVGNVVAVCREAMGRISCPWGHWGLFAKGRVELVDTRNDDIMIFTPLSVHMIADHGFYQGRGSRYRIEPALIVRMFDLTGDQK